MNLRHTVYNILRHSSLIPFSLFLAVILIANNNLIDSSNKETSEEVNNGRDTNTAVIDVINPETGRIWMDRNLGAARAATSITDEQAFGDLYQWGRSADGHQYRDSETTRELSNTDQPGHGRFILVNDSPNDWRNPQNNNLWNGDNGINNPCPVGYRIPTEAEWDEERQSWSSNNTDGAFASTLKLPLAGTREFSGTGSLSSAGFSGEYWSSSVSGSDAILLFFGDWIAGMDIKSRAFGFPVRCIKD